MFLINLRSFHPSSSESLHPCRRPLFNDSVQRVNLLLKTAEMDLNYSNDITMTPKFLVLRYFRVNFHKRECQTKDNLSIPVSSYLLRGKTESYCHINYLTTQRGIMSWKKFVSFVGMMSKV